MGLNFDDSLSYTDTTIHDHVYQAYDGLSKKAGDVTSATYAQAQKLYAKADELKNRYLTTDYIKTKAEQIIRAKMLPLSTPQDLKKEMDKIKLEIKYLSKQQSKQETKLVEANKKIESLIQAITINKSNPGMKNNLERSLKVQRDLQNNYIHLIDAAKKCIKHDQDYLNYLETKRQSTIRGRFTGWAGWVSNIAIPGSGRLVGTVLTVANLLSQQNSVNSLPDHQNVRAKEQKNVNLGTLITVATTVSSIAFSIYAMPIIYEMLSQPTANGSH